MSQRTRIRLLPFLVITPYVGECCTSPHVSIAIETAPRASAATRRVRQWLRRHVYDLDASVAYSEAKIAARFKAATKARSGNGG